MSAAVRAAQGSQNAAGGVSITMTVPAGVVNGDVLVMAIVNNIGAITSPAGWTVLNNTVLGFSLFWRLAASEPASYSVTLVSGKAAGVMIALSGANNNAPIAEQFSFSNNGNLAAILAAALGTFGTHSGIDLYFGCTRVGTTTAQPAGYTEPANGSATNSGGGSAGTKSTCGVATQALINVTTVGSLTATYGAAGTNVGFHVFIFDAPLPQQFQNYLAPSAGDGISVTEKLPH